MQRALVIIPFILLVAAIIILPQINQASESVDIAQLEQQCDIACTEMIAEYRNNPSDQTIWLSNFCTMNVDTSSVGGKFVDHCYSEEEDILRRACILAKFDSTSVSINGTICG